MFFGYSYDENESLFFSLWYPLELGTFLISDFWKASLGEAAKTFWVVTSKLFHVADKIYLKFEYIKLSRKQLEPNKLFNKTTGKFALLARNVQKPFNPISPNVFFKHGLPGGDIWPYIGKFFLKVGFSKIE